MWILIRLYIKVIQPLGIGGCREPLAQQYLHSTPSPSFGKGGAFAMEFKFSVSPIAFL